MMPPWILLASTLLDPVAGEDPAAAADASADTEAATDGEPSPATSARLDRMESTLESMGRDNEQLRRDGERLRQDNERLRRDEEQRHEESARLEERLDALEQQQQEQKIAHDGLLRLSGRLGGYLDVGFFYVGGDGSGIRPDTGHTVFPEFEDVVPDSWVFMGDPLSTQINSRGDPAETGDSRAVTFDPVDSGGKSSFIANAINLDLTTGVGDSLVFEGMVDFIPRNRDVSDSDGVGLGDYVNIKLAYVDYIVPTRRFDLDLYAGKIDTVFGYEYRIQESPDRTTVTPSLLCRYTCGRPVGLKGRAKFLPSRALIWALSLTNGSSFREGFGLANEVDTNHFKTVASRLSYRFDVGAGLELGASGQYGAQDLQPADDVRQWQYGFDGHLDIRGLEVTGEFVLGRVDGDTAPGGVQCDIAPCLRYRGAYGLAGYRATNWLMPYVRVDWRRALHESGTSFAYVSRVLRVTGGTRFELGTHIAIKMEYTINRELRPIPQFRNDVLTTSLVAKI